MSLNVCEFYPQPYLYLCLSHCCLIYIGGPAHHHLIVCPTLLLWHIIVPQIKPIQPLLTLAHVHCLLATNPHFHLQNYLLWSFWVILCVLISAGFDIINQSIIAGQIEIKAK